jgi:chemotaxis protein MotB
MKMNKTIATATVLLVATLFSCVPAKEFQALQDKNQKCEEERERFETENTGLNVKVTETNSKIQVLEKEVEQLKRDSATRVVDLIRLKEDNDRLNSRYAELQQVQESFVSGNQKETRRVLAQLQATQEELQIKEDALKELERKLNNRRKELDEAMAKFNVMKAELDERNARLIELEKILARKDSAVMALRRRVSDALFGFEGKGLSVKIQNGKVYVSLEEKLMFKSGSHVVDANGIAALKQLIPVLEQNKDINIMVEGHTDDVRFAGRGELLDNWDLSVKRATSIVRILLTNSKIAPDRITASGRSEYLPIDAAKTPEARQKNRRTEIILTPKLDELFDILDAN